MLYNIRSKIQKWWFGLGCKDILLKSPPLDKSDESLRIVSMVSHDDLIMYLVAVKSLRLRLGRGRVIILNDGTLTTTDLELLEQHVSPEQVVDARSIDTSPCPKGGTWERLLFIAELVSKSYVVQLDSDTVTIDEIPEAIDALVRNQSFTLGTHLGKKVVMMREITSQMKAQRGNHVQLIAEQNFGKLSDFGKLQYVRGCSAFAGYAKGSFDRSHVERFSSQMHPLLGNIWSNWGSEQVTSNYIISNYGQPRVLPLSRYCYFHPASDYRNFSFLHFIGTHRFKHGVYRRVAREALEKLKTVSK